MKSAVLIAAVLVLTAGCNGGGAVQPHRDFPVVATVRAGGMTVYLSEVRRLGKRIYLVFRYREPEGASHRTSIVCTEITGGFDSEFEKIVNDGWVELRCETDYPIEAKELEFVLRVCEDPTYERADVVLTARVPGVGEVAKPRVAGEAGGVSFSIEALANLKGDSDPEPNGKPEAGAVVVPYGGKNVVVRSGGENVLVVICKAEFPGASPDLPRGYFERHQVMVTAGTGSALGGAPPSTSDTGSARYFALVSVGTERMPREVKACFFSASTLASLRKEFVFSGLPNPLE